MEKNRIILDTSAYSEFFKGNPAVRDAVETADEIYLNAVIIGELLAGFAIGRLEKKNLDILREFTSSPRVETIPIDEETAERYAVILMDLRSKVAPIPTNDLWIAASAMQYGLKIVTKDSHFSRVSQVITDLK